jgi:hypothetical protein
VGTEAKGWMSSVPGSKKLSCPRCGKTLFSNDLWGQEAGESGQTNKAIRGRQA